MFGFYYDVDLGGRQLTPEVNLPAIEKKMSELAAKNNTYIRTEVSQADAQKYFTDKGDEYKLELINERVILK